MSSDQITFMLACGQSTTKVNFSQVELYRELIREEAVQELFPALESWLDNPLDEDALRETLDAIGDTLVVVHGLAISMGLDPVEIKSRIDKSNLSKIPVGESSVLRRADGKILKDFNTFVAPALDDLVESVLDNMVARKTK